MMRIRPVHLLLAGLVVIVALLLRPPPSADSSLEKEVLRSRVDKQDRTIRSLEKKLEEAQRQQNADIDRFVEKKLPPPSEICDCPVCPRAATTFQEPPRSPPPVALRGGDDTNGKCSMEGIRAMSYDEWYNASMWHMGKFPPYACILNMDREHMAKLRNRMQWSRVMPCPGVDFRKEAQMDFLDSACSKFHAEYKLLSFIDEEEYVRAREDSGPADIIPPPSLLYKMADEMERADKIKAGIPVAPLPADYEPAESVRLRGAPDEVRRRLLWERGQGGGGGDGEGGGEGEEDGRASSRASSRASRDDVLKAAREAGLGWVIEGVRGGAEGGADGADGADNSADPSVVGVPADTNDADAAAAMKDTAGGVFGLARGGVSGGVGGDGSGDVDYDESVWEDSDDADLDWSDTISVEDIVKAAGGSAAEAARILHAHAAARRRAQADRSGLSGGDGGRVAGAAEGATGAGAVGSSRATSRKLHAKGFALDAHDNFHSRATGEDEYHPDNGQFGAVDAAGLYCMVRHHKPKRVIEVGAGHSTRVLRHAFRKNTEEGHKPWYVSIEPYPDEKLQGVVKEYGELIVSGAEDVPRDVFLQLKAGDILFIDSSHILRADNEIIPLFLEVLPMLDAGVIIHIHDIYLPQHYRFKYYQSHWFWTEEYLLQALLTHTKGFEIVLAHHYMYYVQQEREVFHRGYGSAALAQERVAFRLVKDRKSGKSVGGLGWVGEWGGYTPFRYPSPGSMWIRRLDVGEVETQDWPPGKQCIAC